MGTSFGEKSNPARGSSEGHKVLAEQPHALRRVIGHEFLGAAGRDPDIPAK